MKTRIELTYSPQVMLRKMAEGNFGAMRVCMDILEHGGKIDPDSALGGFGAILLLDTLGLYGPKIWMLFKDVCGEDLPKMLGVLRGHQLGFITDAQMHHAVGHYGDGIDVADICAKVVERLPSFQLQVPSPA